MNARQQRQTARVQRVIEHLHTNSREEMDSAAIAEIAHLSPYHWHRIYVAATGESAVATLRRIRLQRAATALLRDARPVAEIASTCGFDNLQAFNRLFRKHYGQPPGRFRASNRLQASISPDSPCSPAQGNADPSHVVAGYATAHAADDETAVQIEVHHEWRLAGLWHQGDYNEIGRTFERVMAASVIEVWPRSAPFTVGVYLDDPDVTAEAELRSFAGIPVAQDFTIPDGYQCRHVPGGLHASCLHVGPYALLPDSYRWLYRAWLQSSAHEPRNEPCHEIYLNTPHDTPPTALQTRICLPLSDIA